MKKILSALLLLGTFHSFGEVIRDRIHSIEKVPESFETIVKFTKGRVAFLGKDSASLASEVLKFKDMNIVAELDKNFRLISLYPTAGNELKNLSQFNTETTPPPFEPTVLGSIGEAKALFDSLNSDYKRRSECSDRAHVWSWEMFKSKGIKSEKVYALFTATWIIKTRLKWWFHVAPLVTVNTGNGIEKFVMDFMFTDRPLTVKQWTDNMIFDSRPCKLTNRFSEYDVNPQTEACYMMIDSMYYRLPGDLYKQEQGIYRSSWSASEVSASYRFAFKTVKEVEL